MRKQILTKITSFLLIVSILLPITQPLNASASEYDDFYDLMAEAIALEEALDDISVGSRAGDWTPAIMGQISWNYFHNAVQINEKGAAPCQH